MIQANEITILKESCGGCPMIWDVLLPDGNPGYVKFRWGFISLKPVTERAGIFQDPIIEEKIGEDYDGILSLDAAVLWLKQKGYTVNLEQFKEYYED